MCVFKFLFFNYIAMTIIMPTYLIILAVNKELYLMSLETAFTEIQKKNLNFIPSSFVLPRSVAIQTFIWKKEKKKRKRKKQSNSHVKAALQTDSHSHRKQILSEVNSVLNYKPHETYANLTKSFGESRNLNTSKNRY